MIFTKSGSCCSLFTSIPGKSSISFDVLDVIALNNAKTKNKMAVTRLWDNSSKRIYPISK